MSTAMTRVRPSAPARHLKKKGLIKYPALDYGCGLGADARAYKLQKYDPEFHPIPPEGKFKTILCTYVLNTLPMKEDAEQVLQEIWNLLDEDGVAYVTVRRDSQALKGRTQRGYQWFVMLDADIERFYRYNYMMYRMTKAEPVPKVLGFCAAPEALARMDREAKGKLE